MPRPRRPLLQLTKDEMIDLKAKLQPGAAVTELDVKRTRLILKLTKVEIAALERGSQEHNLAIKLLRAYDLLERDAIATVESAWCPILESIRQPRGEPFTPNTEHLDEALRKANMQPGGARMPQIKRFLMLTELATVSRSVEMTAKAHGWRPASLHHLVWVCKTAGERQAVCAGYIP
jgi:hypothetical protein